MTQEKMTVHAALAELKTMDGRIEKAIRESCFVTAVKKSAEKIKGVTVTEFKNKMKSNYQKVDDLIKRRNAIKRAIVLSNATTMVTISDKQFTVAEAIEMKNHGIEFKRSLLNAISMQYDMAQADITRNSGEALEKRAEKYITDIINAQPKDSKMSADTEAMKSLRETYLNNNSFELIDPLNVVDVMERFDSEINDFLVKVDSTLSVSNALTVIEFEY